MKSLSDANLFLLVLNFKVKTASDSHSLGGADQVGAEGLENFF